MSNPLYSIGTRIVDEEGKAERRVIQLTDSSIIVGPDLAIKGTVNCEKAVICGNTLGVSDNATFAKDLTVNGTTTLETTSVNNLTVSGDTTLSGISAANLSTTGNLTVGGTATINGNATFKGKIYNYDTPAGTGLTTKRIDLDSTKNYSNEGLFVWDYRLIDGYCDFYGVNGIIGWFYCSATTRSTNITTYGTTHSPNIEIWLKNITLNGVSQDQLFGFTWKDYRSAPAVNNPYVTPNPEDYQFVTFVWYTTQPNTFSDLYVYRFFGVGDEIFKAQSIVPKANPIVYGLIGYASATKQLL